MALFSIAINFSGYRYVVISINVDQILKLTKSPQPTYSITINIGCLTVQYPINDTMFGCRGMLFIMVISLRNSSISSTLWSSIEFALMKNKLFQLKWNANKRIFSLLFAKVDDKRSNECSSFGHLK